MAIRVTCPKCHTRFNVSDKFAGKEGPCPKCKSKIKVPAKEEEVVVHAPTASGAVDSQGRPIVDPLRRKETVLSTVQLVLIGACIVGFLAAAFVLRSSFTERADFPMWLMGVAAVLIAPALVYVAYAFLRNQDLAFYVGQELWGRVAICSAIYAITWLAMPLAYYAFDNSYEMGSYVIAAVVMFVAGGVTGMLAFDLDYLMGTVHYGLYFGICLVGRWLAGVGWFPTNLPGTARPKTTTTDLFEPEVLIEAATNFMALLF